MNGPSRTTSRRSRARPANGASPPGRKVVGNASFAEPDRDQQMERSLLKLLGRESRVTTEADKEIS